MEINPQRLTLLVKSINIILVLIAVSLIITAFYAMGGGMDKYSKLPVQLTNGGKFKDIKTVTMMFTYFNLFKVFAVRILYGFILLVIRNMVKAILKGEIFNADHAGQIKRMAKSLLWFACILIFFNLVFVLAIVNNGAVSTVRGMVEVLKIIFFKSYLLTALVALGLTEVFIAGYELKREQDLTI